MTVDRQRFCPVCDRAFNEGEAVLRCDGCGVVHHPGCWVRNGGCYTGGEHENTPHPEAYEMGPALRGIETAGPTPAPRDSRAQADPPAAPQRTIVDIGIRSGAPPPPATPEPVIGRARPNAGPASRAAALPPPPAVAPPRRNRPAPYSARKGAEAGMPRIYGHRRILGYWYVPAAALVAIAVAVSVIWVVERLTGGDDGEAAAVTTETPTETPTPEPGATATPTAPFSVQTAVAGQTPGTIDPNAKFAPGDRTRVVDTGECLNVRLGPGLGNDAIGCLPDGSEVTILGGPQETDGFSWWQVDTPNGQGWAVQDYLEKMP